MTKQITNGPAGVQLRKTKSGKIALYGPAQVIKAGLAVQATNGNLTERLVVRSLGKPFKVEGTPMVYGYFGGDGYSHHISEGIESLGLVR